MGGPINDKDRIQKPCFTEDYNYTNFLAYVLYTPLYLCGPIITFNDFISQVIVDNMFLVYGRLINKRFSSYDTLQPMLLVDM